LSWKLVVQVKSESDGPFYFFPNFFENGGDKS
jgi:hypothetical protein